MGVISKNCGKHVSLISQFCKIFKFTVEFTDLLQQRNILEIRHQYPGQVLIHHFLFLHIGLSKQETVVVVVVAGNSHFFLADIHFEEPMNENSEYLATGSMLQIRTNETQEVRTRWNAKDGPGLFPCVECGKVYRYYRNLCTHRHECGQEPRFHCPYCPLRTKTKSNLKRHVTLKHRTLPSLVDL